MREPPRGRRASRTFLGALTAFALLPFAIGASRPSVYTVERELFVPAPAASLFEEISDFRRWSAWSIWAERDPHMKTEFTGVASALGSTFAWTSDTVGARGKAEVVASDPSRHLAFRVQFLEPRPGTENHDVLFLSVPGGTQIVWRVTLQRSFEAKLASLVMNTDRVYGTILETSIVRLARAAVRS